MGAGIADASVGTLAPVDASRNRDTGGTGLGLAGVRTMILAHVWRTGLEAACAG